MEKSLNQRLKIILDTCYGGNKSSMARAMGVEYQHVNNWLKGTNQPNITTYLSLFEKIQTRINPVWYITGNGPESIEKSGQYNITSISDELENCLKENQSLKSIIDLKQRLLESQDQIISLLQDSKK